MLPEASAYFDRQLLLADFWNQADKWTRQAEKRCINWQGFQIDEVRDAICDYVHSQNMVTVKIQIHDKYRKNKKYLWHWGYRAFTKEAVHVYNVHLLRAYREYQRVASTLYKLDPTGYINMV